MNFPILSVIILIPLIGALFILVTKEEQKTVIKNSKYVAIFSSLANFFLSIFLWYSFDTSTSEFQFVEEKDWIKGFINFQLGIDGISILFILLTTFIAPICIFSGINSIKFKLKEFLRRSKSRRCDPLNTIMSSLNIFNDLFIDPVHYSSRTRE